MAECESCESRKKLLDCARLNPKHFVIEDQQPSPE